MKRFILLFVLILTISQDSYGFWEPSKPNIIPRINWEANELYTSLESPFWQSILESRSNYTPRPVDPVVAEKQAEDNRRTIAYINENFFRENTIVETITHDPKDWFRLAWPLRYTEYVNAIIVHHTTWSYDSDLVALRNIYSFHSLNRWWWDIGYHYIIGLNWIIYEWKKWWDYVVWAHSKWNNNSTVWISVIGDYSEHGVNLAQYESLKSLIKYLTWRYGIDTAKGYYYHMDCYKEYCDTFPLITRRETRLVWHRDTWNTSCPWDALYSQLMYLKREIDEYSLGFVPVWRGEESVWKRDISALSNSLDRQVLWLLQDYSREELIALQSRLSHINTRRLSKDSQDLVTSLNRVTRVLIDM